MARRRRQGSGGSRFLVIALVLGAAAAGWWFWQKMPHGPDSSATPAATTADGSQEIALPPPRVAADALCAKLGDLRVATLLSTSSVGATPLPAEAGVPRAAGCTWRTAEGAEIRAMWFNDASLALGSGSERGAAYFQSAVTGLEYALKLTPERLTGLGDEAVAAGFVAPAAAQGQVIARRGEHVLTVESRGVARASAVRMAEALVAQL